MPYGLASNTVTIWGPMRRKAARGKVRVKVLLSACRKALSHRIAGAICLLHIRPGGAFEDV
eukprot:749150-Amphidinium_carterae.1